jgi:peptidoglycan DL-endopeptidase CwlO
MKNYTKYSALVSTILLSVALFAAPAHADTDTSIHRETFSAGPVAISAPSNVKLHNDSPKITTTPAPVAKPVVKAPVYVQETTKEPVVSDRVGSAPTTPTQTLTAPKAKVETRVSASGKGASIAAAAYAQLGVPQDCTALVTNSLAAVGVHYHGWPAGYFSVGHEIPASQAQAGDLAYYANGGTGMAHIAVYVGNGMAVHGGWNGGTTALYSVNVGSGPVFIRVA